MEKMPGAIRAAAARRYFSRKDTHQGGLSATVVACQRGLFSGIDNQIEIGKQNFLIGMDIAEVFDNDTHKNTVFRVDNIGVRMTHFQLSQGCGEQTNTVRAKHTPFE